MISKVSIVSVKAFRKRRCLYFYSPNGLVKIRYNSQKYSAILHTKTSKKIYLSTTCSTSVATKYLVFILVLKVIMCRTCGSSASFFFKKLFAEHTNRN